MASGMTMELISFLAESPPGETRHMVMNVVSPFGNFAAGIGIGKITGGQIEMTQVSVDCCTQLAQMTPQSGYKLHVVEVSSNQPSTEEKIISTLQKAESGDRLFFICHDTDIYRAVYDVLKPREAIPASNTLH